MRCRRAILECQHRARKGKQASPDWYDFADRSPPQRGPDADALAAFRAARRLGGLLAAPHYLVPAARPRQLQALVRLGELEQAEQALAGLGEQDRDRGEIRTAVAALRLAQDDPDAAAVALAPALDGSALVSSRNWLVQSFMLEAIARDAFGDPGAAERALERALDLAEPDGVLLPFLLDPAPGLLGHHARYRTAHASLLAEIRGLLAGRKPAPPPAAAQPPLEPHPTEIRVLRYLPTNLSAREIGNELYVSQSTVKTHMHHLPREARHAPSRRGRRARPCPGPARALPTSALTPARPAPSCDGLDQDGGPQAPGELHRQHRLTV